MGRIKAEVGEGAIAPVLYANTGSGEHRLFSDFSSLTVWSPWNTSAGVR